MKVLTLNGRQQPKWDKNLELLEYFSEKTNGNTYEPTIGMRMIVHSATSVVSVMIKRIHSLVLGEAWTGAQPLLRYPMIHTASNALNMTLLSKIFPGHF